MQLCTWRYRGICKNKPNSNLILFLLLVRGILLFLLKILYAIVQMINSLGFYFEVVDFNKGFILLDIGTQILIVKSWQEMLAM